VLSFVFRGLGHVAAIFGRRLGPGGQVRLVVLLAQGYLGGWPTCRATRPRSSIVNFRGRDAHRKHRFILIRTFLVVFVVCEAVRIALIFTLGVFDGNRLLPAISFGIQHVH